jgi:hypothetical protein
VILKDSKEAIQADINARRLNHCGIKWFDDHAPGINLRGNISVAQQHGSRPYPSLSGCA